MTTPKPGDIVYHKVNEQKMIVLGLVYPAIISGTTTYPNGGYGGGQAGGVGFTLVNKQDKTKPALAVKCRFIDPTGAFVEQEFRPFELKDKPTESE